MTTTRLRYGMALGVAAAVGCAGCLPIPLQVYVADPAVGTPIMSTCSFDRHVPSATELEIGGVKIQVSLAQAFEPHSIELRLDIPAGKTVRLEGDVIRIEVGAARTPLEARFADVSLVDEPLRQTRTAAIQAFIVPVTTPLVGERLVRGPVAWDKHFWIGARVDVGNAETLWVTLPPFTINGVAARVEALRFDRRTVWGAALMNC